MLLRPEMIQPGDVVTYWPPKSLMTRRARIERVIDGGKRFDAIFWRSATRPKRVRVKFCQIVNIKRKRST